MKRRKALAFVALAAMPTRLLAGPSRRRVAFFSTQHLEVVAPRVEAFRKRLAEKGFVDGANLELRFFAPADDEAGMEEAIRTMVAWRPEVIHAAFAPVILAIRKATDRIPIVYRGVGDPILVGLIASYARPAGNITGVSSPGHLLVDKLLELAREILPGARRFVILRDALRVPSFQEAYSKFLERARALNFDCIEVPVALHANGLREALEQAVNAGADVLLPMGALPNVRGPLYPVLIEFERRRRVPVLFTTVEVVRDGALMGYGFEVIHAVQLAANMVAAILGGANAGDIPAEVASRVELALNLTRARELGIQFPRSVLLRADWVIE